MKLILAGEPRPDFHATTLTSDSQLQNSVAATLADVRARGDAALLESARRFDAPQLDAILVPSTHREGAPNQLAPEELETLSRVYQAVLQFHLRQRASLEAGWPGGTWRTEGEDILGQRLLPVQRAGIYVPGGRANYPSSVLMNAVPAFAAGVTEIFVASPADRDGKLSPAVLTAGEQGEFRVREFFRVGGAAAIAAFAFGTESVPRVDVIAGPGNRYVNEAKRQVWGLVGLDGFAGPSEVCILVDQTSNAEFAAVDLLTQIEHAPDNVGYLLGTDESKVREVLARAEALMEKAERREVLRHSWMNGYAVVAPDLVSACEVVNEIAPEHLGIAVNDPEPYLARIQNAGCILLGEWSPESAGDYAAGPSHTLPTAGAARFQSPVNVLTFLKLQSLIGWTRETLLQNAGVIERMGSLEGFPMHGYGATVRRPKSP